MRPVLFDDSPVREESLPSEQSVSSVTGKTLEPLQQVGCNSTSAELLNEFVVVTGYDNVVIQFPTYELRNDGTFPYISRALPSALISPCTSQGVTF